MCADAYEFAGRPDRALEYLQELVAVKRKTIDIDIMQLGADGYGEGSELQNPTFRFLIEVGCDDFFAAGWRSTPPPSSC